MTGVGIGHWGVLDGREVVMMKEQADEMACVSPVQFATSSGKPVV